MHSSAKRNLKRFFETYFQYYDKPTILEIGSLCLGNQWNVKELKNEMNINFEYIGVDTKAGKNVNMVLKDSYSFELIQDSSIDIAISTSTFEHIEFFWLSYLEILRVLKPNGLFYLNAPSNGDYHSWPVDCWRFYPDSGIALINWAKKNQYNPILLESFVSKQYLENGWNDFVAVTLKDASFEKKYTNKIINKYKNYYNGHTNNQKILNFQNKTEDHLNFAYRFIYKLRKKLQKMGFLN